MLSANDLQNLRQELQNNNIDTTLLDNTRYIDNQKVDINNAFKTVFGPLGPNSKGLIVLSQKTKNAQMDSTCLDHIYHYSHCSCHICHTLCHEHRYFMSPLHYTSCLYTGDARIKTQKEIQTIKDFLQIYCHEQTLSIMQLPHHGSKYNIHNELHKQIIADLYFLHDNTDKRIKQSQPLYTDLKANRKLHVVKDRWVDVIVGVTHVY
jgi:hypothetical protein